MGKKIEHKHSKSCTIKVTKPNSGGMNMLYNNSINNLLKFPENGAVALRSSLIFIFMAENEKAGL